MQEENFKKEKSTTEPFVIWKNARKEIKKQDKKRKQSYQYPTTATKTRKMTIQLSHVKSLQQQPDFARNSSQEFSNKDIKEQDQEKNPQKKIEEIRMISQQYEEVNNHPEQQVQLQNNIPFNCDQWELDKESPYLRNFSSSNMDQQIDKLNLDN